MNYLANCDRKELLFQHGTDTDTLTETRRCETITKTIEKKHTSETHLAANTCIQNMTVQTQPDLTTERAKESRSSKRKRQMWDTFVCGKMMSCTHQLIMRVCVCGSLCVASRENERERANCFETLFLHFWSFFNPKTIEFKIWNLYNRVKACG